MDLSSKVLKTSRDGIHIISVTRCPPGEKLFLSIHIQPTKLKFVMVSCATEKSLALSSCNYSSSNCRLHLVTS